MKFTDERRVRLSGDWCVYCGQVAETVEHFPPKSYCLDGLLMPACKECNSLAGTDWPTDFGKRKDLVNERLKRRHAKALNTPVWTQEELKEMKRGMRKEIEIWQTRRRIAERRIAWNAEGYLAYIDRNNDFAKLSARLSTSTEQSD